MQQNIQVSRVLVSFCLEAEEAVVSHSVPGNTTSYRMTSFDLISYKLRGIMHEPTKNYRRNFEQCRGPCSCKY